MSSTPNAPQDPRWQAKQAHYQDPEVAQAYDAQRFQRGRARGDTARMLAAAQKLLGAHWESARSVLDMPCGTGRFEAALERAGRLVVAADLSRAMLDQVSAAGVERLQADALALPFQDQSFDLVLCMRFLFHVPQELKAAVLAELARVARGPLIIDVRHSWAWSAQSRAWRARLFGQRASPRLSPRAVDALFAAAGLRIEKRHYFAPGFSEKLLVLAWPTRLRSPL